MSNGDVPVGDVVAGTRQSRVKKMKPAVRVRISSTGQMIRRKRKLTADEVAARRQAAVEHEPPPREKIVAIMARAKSSGRALPKDARQMVVEEARRFDSRKGRASPTSASQDAFPQVVDRLERAQLRAAEDQSRRAAYLKSVADRRVAASGASGKRAHKVQADVYRLLGLDPKAGFAGRAPAFEVLDSHKVGRAELLGSVRNVAQDPLHLLRDSITERQYGAMASLVDLFEQYSAVGMRPVLFAEQVDCTNSPDVDDRAIDIVRTVNDLVAATSRADLMLLTSVAIKGQTISDLARIGTFGANRSRIKIKLDAAMDRLASFFDRQPSRRQRNRRIA